MSNRTSDPLDAEADLIDTIPEAARTQVAEQATVQRYLAVARAVLGRQPS